MAEPTKRRGRRWVRRVLDATFLLLTIAFLVFMWPARFGGSSTFVIVGGHSMEPTYEIGDIVVLRKGDPKVGDVVAFDPELKSPNAPLVIHRIIGGGPEGWVMQGDNNPNPDSWKPTNEQIVGVAMFHVPGAVKVLDIFRNPLFYAVLAGMAAVLILWPRRGDGNGGAEPSPDADADPDLTDEAQDPAPTLDDSGDAAEPAPAAAQEEAERSDRALEPVGLAAAGAPRKGPGRARPWWHLGFPWRTRRALIGSVIPLVVVASLISVSAASLTVEADDLMAQVIPGDRCDDVISAMPVISDEDPLVYDHVELSDVAPACAGLEAQIVVMDDGGDQLAAGTATAAGGSFVVTFSPPVGLADYDGIALAIDGWGIPTVPVGDDIQNHIERYDDLGHSYCANVTSSTTSSDPIPLVTTIDLSTYPINGEPYEVWWDITLDYDELTLSALVTGFGQQGFVSLGHPVVWGFCANRPDDPPPGDVVVEVEIYDDVGHQYCANVTVSTDSEIPITWEVALDFSTAPMNGVPDQVWNAVWSFDAPVLTASGVGWNSIIQDGVVAPWGFCANRPDDPDPPDPDPGTFTYDIQIVNDWGSGYEALVTVSTTSTTDVAWEIAIDFSNPPVNGTPTNVWNVATPWQAGWNPPILTVAGPAWDPKIRDGEPATFGFTANR